MKEDFIIISFLIYNTDAETVVNFALRTDLSIKAT